jgi:tetratricopeptide (TPR) repeat protein
MKPQNQPPRNLQDIDYLVELTYQQLSNNFVDGLQLWANLLDFHLENWQLENCWKMLQIVKRASLSPDHTLMAKWLSSSTRGKIEAHLGNWDIAITAFENSLDIVRQINNLEAEAWLLSDYGNILYLAGRNHHALNVYKRALDIYTEYRNPMMQSRMQSALGGVYRNLGELDLSSEFFEQAWESQGKHELDITIAVTLVNWGTVLQLQGKLIEAEEQYIQALIYFQKEEHLQYQAQVLGNLGTLYLDSNRVTEALNCFLKDIELTQLIGDIVSQAKTLNNLAITYRRLGKQEQALSCYQNCIDIQNDLGNTSDLISTLINMANLYRVENNHSAMREVLEKALTASKALNDLERIAHIKKILQESREEGI